MRCLGPWVLVFMLGACASSTSWQPGDRGPGPKAELGTSLDGGADRSGRGERGSGCQKDGDCAGSPMTPFCQTWSGTCVACEQGNALHACQGGKTCCGTSCFDTQQDPANCGTCGNSCGFPNAITACAAGLCKIKSCKTGYLDCDLALENGCEQPSGDAGTCACPPKSTRSCYTGPTATEGVGACKAGVSTCNDAGTGWGPCLGEVLPAPDSCDNNLDDNCDGALNNGYPSAPGCGCLPAAEQPCYTGPTGTEGKGTCKAGKQICQPDGKAWGACEGEVIPLPQDSCFNLDDEDCDGAINNGYASGAPGCACAPGTTLPCYTGPAGTEGKGTCKGGQRSCDGAGTGWGPCMDEVVPSLDLCSNGLDEDCDGGADNPPDQDGDGWSTCQGDCCDLKAICSNPELVNPGAFDVQGNNVDDDCDFVVDNPPAPCDSGLASDSGNPLDYARAMDLCQLTTEVPPSPHDKKWGVISAQLLKADGTALPHQDSRSIRPGFGNVILPRQGSSLAVLSSGNAADSKDTSPGYVQFQDGRDMGTSSGFPADWLAANGGKLPNAPGCPGIYGGTSANDPVMLKLRIRVPTNAHSFSFSTYFFSAEYPEYTCSPYNDFFVALLDSSFGGTPANPADRNLAFYDPPPDGAPYYPVGVNLAYGNTGLFRQCQNGASGCALEAVTGNISTCQSTAELSGTGFDVSKGLFGCPWAYNKHMLGGGTGWLTTRGNVQPGEIIEVRLAIWDTSDHILDSLVLLDNWVWSVTSSKPGTD